MGEAESSWRGWLRDGFVEQAGSELGLAALGSLGLHGRAGRGCTFQMAGAWRRRRKSEGARVFRWAPDIEGASE